MGATGAPADPQVRVVSGTAQLARNDNWETGSATAAQLIAVSAQIGAFALSAGRKDAALLITLQPGTCNVVRTGVGLTAGVALTEVCDIHSRSPPEGSRSPSTRKPRQMGLTYDGKPPRTRGAVDGAMAGPIVPATFAPVKNAGRNVGDGPEFPVAVNRAKFGVQITGTLARPRADRVGRGALRRSAGAGGMGAGCSSARRRRSDWGGDEAAEPAAPSRGKAGDVCPFAGGRRNRRVGWLGWRR